MRAAKVVAICAFSFLTGCFGTTKQPPLVKQSVNIPSYLLEQCSPPPGPLETGAEETVIAVIKDLLSLYKQCRAKHEKVTGTLCKAVNCQKTEE